MSQATHTPSASDRQETARIPKAERDRRFLERQTWIDAAQSCRDLTPVERLFAGRLGWHKNLVTGQCNPGYGTLAGECGYDKDKPRAAIRAIAALERRGWIKIERTAGGRGSETNSYTLIIPANAVTSDATTHDTTTRVDADVTRDKTGGAPVSPRHPNLKEPIRSAPKGAHTEGERVIALARDDDPDPGGAGADARAPDEENRFRDLWTLWDRGPWIDREGDARRAYAVACTRAHPDDIVGAAMIWVEAADAPRYLPKLADWLDADGWRKPPPKRRTRRASHGGARRTGRRADLTSIMMALP